MASCLERAKTRYAGVLKTLLARCGVACGVAFFLGGMAASPLWASEPLGLRQRLIQYIEAIQTLEATFQEEGPQRKARGKIFLRRPPKTGASEYGKLKFLYEDPVGLVVVSVGGTVYVCNTQTQTQETTPLSSTPLFVFMRSEVRLGDAAVEKRLSRVGDRIHWVLADADAPDGSQSHQLTLIFSPSPLALVGWSIQDPTGQKTHVTLECVTAGHPLKDHVFEKPSLKGP